MSGCSHEWFGCSKCGAAPDEGARLRALLAERERECERLAAGYVRAEELDAAIERLEAKIAEYEALLERWREREQPWVERWQRETGKADALPDYGEILGWIADKAEANEAKLARAELVVAALGPVLNKIRAVPDNIVTAPVDDSIILATLTFGEVRAVRAALDAPEGQAG